MSKYGIENAIKFLDRASDLSVDVIELTKEGFGFGAIKHLVTLASQLKDLAIEAKAALPELTDLDSQEALDLGAAAYEAVSKVVSAV